MDVNPVKIPAPQPKQLPRKSRKGKAEVNRCKTVMAQGVLWQIGHWVCFTKLRQFSVESQKYCGVFPSAFFKFKFFSCLRKLSLSFNPKRGRNNPTCDLGTLVFAGFMQLTRFFSSSYGLVLIFSFVIIGCCHYCGFGCRTVEFTLPRSLIGPANPRRPLNQSDADLKAIVSDSLAFPAIELYSICVFSYAFLMFHCRKSVDCNMAGITAFSLSEIEEGSETEEFWKVIGGKKYYCSLAHGM